MKSYLIEFDIMGQIVIDAKNEAEAMEQFNQMFDRYMTRISHQTKHMASLDSSIAEIVKS